MHCPLEGRKYAPLFILNGTLKDVLQMIDINTVCIQSVNAFCICHCVTKCTRLCCLKLFKTSIVTFSTAVCFIKSTVPLFVFKHCRWLGLCLRCLALKTAASLLISVTLQSLHRRATVTSGKKVQRDSTFCNLMKHRCHAYICDSKILRMSLMNTTGWPLVGPVL